LFDLQPGGRVWMDDKCDGAFTLDTVPRGVNLVMISTGTGVAPFVSMLRTYANTNRWRRLALIDCARRAADLGYREQLEALARDDESVTYLPTVTREPTDAPWPGLRGRVQPMLEPDTFDQHAGFAPDPQNTHVLLCGNPAMIDGVTTTLESRGFTAETMKQPGNIHFERYW
jgi:ferredoxin--NADP+ reductase